MSDTGALCAFFFQNLVALRANRPKVEFCGFRWLWQKWWMFNLVLRDGFSRNAWQRKVVFEIPRSARVVCFALDLQFSNIALFLFSSPLLLCESVSVFPSIFCNFSPLIPRCPFHHAFTFLFQINCCFLFQLSFYPSGKSYKSSLSSFSPVTFSYLAVLSILMVSFSPCPPPHSFLVPYTSPCLLLSIGPFHVHVCLSSILVPFQIRQMTSSGVKPMNPSRAI